MHTSANCLGRNSGCLAINVYEIQGFQGWFYLIFVIFHVSNFCLGIRQSFCKTLFRHLMITSILLMERQISGSPWKSEKSIFLGFLGSSVKEYMKFRTFQGLIDTLHLQSKLVSYFHSNSSILWLTLLSWHWTCQSIVPVFWIFESSIKCRLLHLVSLLFGLKIWQFK